MYTKIVLAGGSGYLGKVLQDYFSDKATEIMLLSRKAGPAKDNVRHMLWDGRTAGPWTDALNGCDLLVNLCGKNVNCRYTPANQAEIIRSRTEPTALLGNVIATLPNPPKVWINLASATIYRHAEDRPQDELTGDIGTGFSIDVCNAWEQTFSNAHAPATKKIVLRTGIVFGRRDGVYPRLRNLVLTGLGGCQGHGGQYVSWMHELDFARSVDWLFHNGRDGEIYNATAPAAITNAEMMRIIRTTLGVPFGLPTPQWLLEIGAALIGTETELILKSRWYIQNVCWTEALYFSFPFSTMQFTKSKVAGFRI